MANEDEDTQLEKELEVAARHCCGYHWPKLMRQAAQELRRLRRVIHKMEGRYDD